MDWLTHNPARLLHNARKSSIKIKGVLQRGMTTCPRIVSDGGTSPRLQRLHPPPTAPSVPKRSFVAPAPLQDSASLLPASSTQQSTRVPHGWKIFIHDVSC